MSALRQAQPPAEMGSVGLRVLLQFMESQDQDHPPYSGGHCKAKAGNEFSGNVAVAKANRLDGDESEPVAQNMKTLGGVDS